MSTQKEDVFETPDYPEEEPVEREETFDSEHIESIHVNVDAALKRFKGRMLSADAVDFSDNLWNRRRQGYGSGKFVLEIVGKENAEREHETVEQKFNRLYCEVGELAEMIKDEASSGNAQVQEVDVKGLSELLDMVHRERLTGAIPSESALEKLKRAQENKKESSQKPSSDIDFSHLDTRLKRIEKFVSGSQPTAERVTSTPLAETVEELRLRIETVNPSVLDGLETKLNTVLGKYQTVEEKRQERLDGVVEEKINHLSEMMAKWDGVCMSLPGTVKRLHALTNLHEQARDFSTNLQLLISTKNELLRKLESEEMSVFELKKETLEMIRSLNNRVSEVQNAVESLKKK
uniref:Dynactin subunit 2 n=1 Tax=Steinernema glaseri TaxID=37863 RepID=A0A1I8AVP4_9BILA